MAHVQVIQRHAHLAGPVKLDTVNGREGPIARASFTAISNTRRGSGEEREEEATAVHWTLWGRQAENAAAYLHKGSHVNVLGRLRNTQYEQDDRVVYGMSFTAEEVDYLDSRADAQTRRDRRTFVEGLDAQEAQEDQERQACHQRATRVRPHAKA